MVLCRSPRQTQDKFEKCSDNLDLNPWTLSKKNVFLVVALPLRVVYYKIKSQIGL